MKLLYDEYRGERYFLVRNSWEPSYSKNLNSSLDEEGEGVNFRRSQMENLISQAFPHFHETARVVVDFGGGHGNLMPQWTSLNKKFVIDISGVSTTKDVYAVRSWNEIPAQNHVDLVMCCMVLEHVVAPEEFIRKLKQEFLLRSSVRLEESIFYFEVPAGIPRRKRFVLKTFMLVFASWFKWSWRQVDVLITKNSKDFPLRIAEHLNFFTDSGLRMLLERCGFEVISSSGFSVNHKLMDSRGIKFTDTLAVVARLSK